MDVIVYLLNLAINVYIGIIVIEVAVGWLIAFDVVNAENQQARNLTALLAKATNPVYSRLRKYVPPIGGIDITPLVVILALTLVQSALNSLLG